MTSAIQQRAEARASLTTRAALASVAVAVFLVGLKA